MKSLEQETKVITKAIVIWLNEGYREKGWHIGDVFTVEGSYPCSYMKEHNNCVCRAGCIGYVILKGASYGNCYGYGSRGAPHYIFKFE